MLTYESSSNWKSHRPLAITIWLLMCIKIGLTRVKDMWANNVIFEYKVCNYFGKVQNSKYYCTIVVQPIVRLSFHVVLTNLRVIIVINPAIFLSRKLQFIIWFLSITSCANWGNVIQSRSVHNKKLTTSVFCFDNLCLTIINS